MKEYITEQINDINSKLNKYKLKTYTIEQGEMLVTDSKEYSKLLGEKRVLERIYFLLNEEVL